MIADMESLQKRLTPLQKKARSGDKELAAQVDMIERVLKVLEDGKAARTVERSEDEEKTFQMLQLLTSKPLLYVCNVGEDEAADGNEHSARVKEMADAQGAETVIISAAMEAEIAQLDSEEDKRDFLEAAGLEEPGLNRVIKAGYNLLNLITFFTAGPKEARAWTVERDSKAPQAAGVIHTDFERGFIKAETIAYDDYSNLGGEQKAKEAGKMRQEGKEYVVQDGDILLFRFNV